jgi:N-acetylated-alpha-linked acidic dipeptidase
MSDADVLPYDYQNYATEIMQYTLTAEKHAREVFGEGTPDFSPVLRAARRFVTAGRIMHEQQQGITRNDDVERMNAILINTERDLLLPKGLPKRPWFRHSIFAPADMKGYTASVIPGVNEAIEYGDLAVATDQMNELAKALNRAAARLESYRLSE